VRSYLGRLGSESPHREVRSFRVWSGRPEGDQYATASSEQADNSHGRQSIGPDSRARIGSSERGQG
jgi:hypothetical protein